MSNSQINQDLAVLEFYKYKRDGYFVEIGAYDGIALSNTLVLEKTYGWTGILSEVVPDRYEQLLVNRPKCHCNNSAVYSKSNMEVSFDIANDSNMLSGISSHINAHKHVVNKNKSQIIVETISLTDLLDLYKAPSFIEYLSLDTEGSELEILKGLDHTKYTFGIIHVEHNDIPIVRSQLKLLLENNGYKFLRKNHFDDEYIHNTLA
jgi:FkbM family methyltransferase